MSTEVSLALSVLATLAIAYAFHAWQRKLFGSRGLPEAAAESGQPKGAVPPQPRRRRLQDRFGWQPRLVRHPIAKPDEYRRLGRLPEQLDIARPGRGARVELLRMSLTRPSSPKTCFAVRSCEVRSLQDALDGTATPQAKSFETTSLALRVELQPGERLGHFLDSMRYRHKSEPRRVVVCEASELAHAHARVQCLTVAHRDALELSDSEVLSHSVDPLYSGFPHRQFFSLDSTPRDALWLVRVPTTTEALVETAESELAARPRCLNYCGRCERKDRRWARTLGDPPPYRVVRYAFLFLLLSTGTFSTVAFFELLGAAAPGWSGIIDSAATVALNCFRAATGAAAALCAMLLSLLAAKNLRAYARKERRYHRLGDQGVPWMATTTRCLADGDHIRHGWRNHEWDVLGE